MPEVLVGDESEIEQESEPQITPNALAILNQSEHAAMVQTANLSGNRRNLKAFDSRLHAYACGTPEIALSMFYSLPRAGKQIIGPSVRFAEVVAPCWKNCAVGSRGIGDSTTTVTAQGVFLDYEANLRNSVEVPRRITDKNGKRFGDDMIVTTLNAAMSVARRNAVLKGGVPQALWSPAYEDAKLTAVGKAASHAQRVDEAMNYLHKLGLTDWQILGAVGVPDPRELETEHLVTLRVLLQEIKRGDKTVEEVFGSQHDKEIEALFTQLKMNDAQKTMLRNSYMGRAKDLVEYLRSRLGPAERPKPSIDATQGGATDQQPIEDRVAQSSTQAWNDREQRQAGAQQASTTGPVTGTSGTTTVATGPEPEGLSIFGGEPQAPAPKRGGRPTKAEAARKAAQAAPETEPEPEPPSRFEDVPEQGGEVPPDADDSFAF